ncbi:hypothetical protein P4H39_18685 [Paenibacillus lautus]|uniref:hypothetical protein n=1 Tax=Paenibacillus lautus TaxID=1401 RepID=UPI002DB5E97D|nr:hypothetical protein [Paenibacillus lautus]MEC0204633.1 hypothetical protein [Paenibacillus lautus]
MKKMKENINLEFKRQRRSTGANSQEQSSVSEEAGLTDLLLFLFIFFYKLKEFDRSIT